MPFANACGAMKRGPVYLIGAGPGASGAPASNPKERNTPMYADTIEGFTKLAERKIAAMRASPLGFFVASMLAGAYVGIGIILIFTLGNQAPVEFQKLIMGATFGIALTLVVIAGAELFTGHTMFMALRGYRGFGTLGDIGASWTITWVGNLAGSPGLVALFPLGGGGGLLSPPDPPVMEV